MINNVTLVGRLVRDPELAYLQSGTAICKFTLALDKQLSKEKKAEMEAQNQPTADFINVIVWGKMGENSANYLAKGRLVGITGRLQSGSYDGKDGIKRYTTDVVANQVQFLEWGDTNTQQNNSNQNQGGTKLPEPNFNGIEGFSPSNDDIPF